MGCRLDVMKPVTEFRARGPSVAWTRLSFIQPSCRCVHPAHVD
jgi:hypothetical protein